MQRLEFTFATQQLALGRQKYRCACCGAIITHLGEAGRAQHPYGEIAHAHHVRHAKFGGINSLDNCVIICAACHYAIHEGGNYRYGTVVGRPEDFPYFNG